MSFFGLSFGGNADIDILLDGQEDRKMAEIKDENGRKERHYLYFDGESVTGKVNVTLHRKTNRLEHQGIKIEFIGQIELYYDRGNHHEFLSLVKQLAGPGDLTQNTAFDFEFNQVEKPYECYTGANVRLRYFLRVTVVRRLTDMTKEMDLLVHTLATYPEMNNPIKMEVGIEECLHIEFEYNKSKYHLKDVIVGKIYFLLVRIKIKHMEVTIIKRETTGSGPNTFNDNENIAKYEIMDGAPVKGESIPIRVFLAGYDITPTMRDINKKFSVKYYLNLVLVDEEERRYFKQQEITLWRKGERMRKNFPPSASNSVHQLPHAMARHSAGDMPSQNIRTAPTPSEPNTPITGPNSATEGVMGGIYHSQGASALPGPPIHEEPVGTTPIPEERPTSEVSTPDSAQEVRVNEPIAPEPEPIRPEEQRVVVEETSEMVPKEETEPVLPANPPKVESIEIEPELETPKEDQSQKQPPKEKQTDQDQQSSNKKDPSTSQPSPDKFRESPPPMNDDVDLSGDNNDMVNSEEENSNSVDDLVGVPSDSNSKAKEDPVPS
ncbi:hypothetical protein TCAL_12568 [Tigriopus californicus]|uniref:Vacuolar protein sorting-associated protein 26 n=1 Tax=Tigriopus californicus TaxID=6832 RepID=A0A553PB47_TIGCA|nr:vacuolar protein sorting-associated protein 26B-like [Tigriopus californicus]TRY74869.1 hypothetical protein TCAL_12568 [Tigriopus californicus]|eukprot:TCALIF_12568-PA protein Name:"Similar to vps26bl Vacuolar protein sorting-associated protein 26B-like (Danio rerio)" AED:0.08 eAED:0.08 QI:90/1/1/1/0.83/0.85/7/337/548